MTKKLVISIINYRTVELTIQAVQSALDALGSIDGHIVVVDNLSNDGSVERLESWIAAQPEGTPVSLVCSPRNTGFSGGHNLGMGAYEAEYYLVLNSDALLRPGFLNTILEAADRTPEAGLFAPRIEHENGDVQHSCFRFHSPASEFARAVKTGVFSRLLSRRLTSLGPDPDPGQIEWVSFACVLLRAALTRDLGPMDEGYFLYFEDAEYCLRARRAGWAVAYVPEAVVIHYRGGSSPVKARMKTRASLPIYYYRSRARFLYQAHGRFGLLMANFGWHIGRMIKHATRLLGRSIHPMPAREGYNIWANFWFPLTPDGDPAQPDRPEAVTPTQPSERTHET